MLGACQFNNSALAVIDGCVTAQAAPAPAAFFCLASPLQQCDGLAGCVSGFPPVDNEIKVGWRLGVHTGGKQARGIKPAAFQEWESLGSSVSLYQAFIMYP